MLGLRALDMVYLPAELTKKSFSSVNVEHLILEVKRLSVTLGGVKILKDISFSAGKGEILGIMGKNGVGKTTLARTLCGICREIGGEIWIDGVKMRRKQRSKSFSFVMQDVDYQLFTESVEDELRFGNTKVPDLEHIMEDTLGSLDLKGY